MGCNNNNYYVIYIIEESMQHLLSICYSTRKFNSMYKF